LRFPLILVVIFRCSAFLVCLRLCRPMPNGVKNRFSREIPVSSSSLNFEFLLLLPQGLDSLALFKGLWLHDAWILEIENPLEMQEQRTKHTSLCESHGCSTGLIIVNPATFPLFDLGLQVSSNFDSLLRRYEQYQASIDTPSI
jgi:hypothetical protein